MADRENVAAQAAQVPEGWRLVPIEPDDAMVDAVRSHVDLEVSDVEDHRYSDGFSAAKEICKSVIAAAPNPPAPPQPAPHAMMDESTICEECDGQGGHTGGRHEDDYGRKCEECDGTGMVGPLLAQPAAVEPAASDVRDLVRHAEALCSAHNRMHDNWLNGGSPATSIEWQASSAIRTQVRNSIAALQSAPAVHAGDKP